MPAFVSPIKDPATWTLARTTALTTLPAGLRYAGYVLPGVRATRAIANSVQMPATGILRRVASGASDFQAVVRNWLQAGLQQVRPSAFAHQRIAGQVMV